MKIYVVGMGPGSIEQMTQQARDVLNQSDVIIGYDTYIQLLADHFPEKKQLSTGMRREVERCHLLLEEALKGQTVAMVCSGDAGIYGMAGLVYEIAQQYPPIDIEIVAGITAANSGAAVLGAPLMHDFAVISLSDLLTPMEKIEKRLAAAAAADFVLCLYNPSSKKRHDYLQKACDIVLQYQAADTICGLVRNIGRDEEEGQLLTLAELRNKAVDMFTTVYIGNSQTRRIGDRMVTPRGYRNV